jgi:hypothetical protein
MHHEGVIERLARGAPAGFVGTLVLQGLLRGNDVRAQDGRSAAKDTAVILGTVGINFTY